MEGTSREVAEHILSINPEYKPIQHRARQFSGEKDAVIQEEVAKLLRAGIIEDVQYPTWIANVVMVLKASKKWRMPVDYVDLNKACPKDWYSLPRIDRLVDFLSGHKILSFVDAYSGYHQIKINREVRIHTTFRAIRRI